MTKLCYILAAILGIAAAAMGYVAVWTHDSGWGGSAWITTLIAVLVAAGTAVIEP